MAHIVLYNSLAHNVRRFLIDELATVTPNTDHCFVALVLALEILNIREGVKTVNAAARPKVNNYDFVQEFSSE